MNDPHRLQRFLDAQAAIYSRVTAELAAGRKMSHWMWFVFPQLKGLGRSATAQHFGLSSLEEARAYWAHPVLGGRLKECIELVLAVQGRTAHDIFGTPDDLKFGSCLTLFEQAEPHEAVFARAIERYFGGRRDANTLALL